MKKNLVFMTWVSLVAAVSCARMPMEEALVTDEVENQELGTLVFKVGSDVPKTRAESVFGKEEDYEHNLNKVEIFVFDNKTGELNGYFNAENNASGTMNVTVGEKDVWAVANSSLDFTGVTKRDDFLNLSIALEDNSTDPSKGFVMAGNTETAVNVKTGETVDASVTVRRFTSRIALVKVVNKLPPAYKGLEIKDVFLSNVVASQSIGGETDVKKWYNAAGLSGEDKIGFGISGNQPQLTHNTDGISVDNGAESATEICLYSYPNDSEDSKTRLILTSIIDGKNYYYPVEIPCLLRNTSYDVSVTITGLGVDDPDGKIEKGGIEFIVTPKEWDMGDAIEKEL